MTTPQTVSSVPSTLTVEELCGVFSAAEKSPEQYLIGAESEKFGVHRQTGAPLGYGGDFSVCHILGALARDHGWTEMREVEGGPILGLRRGGASVTLEPSAQLELSGDALPDLHGVSDEAHGHLAEIAAASDELDIAWLGTGFHPLCTREQLPWVPKMRYPIMREYLPKMGSGGLDMMQRTCTTQGNFDWSSEADAMRKMRAALKLSPLIQAWFSNAPFSEGKKSASLSLRAHVWRNMDPSRSGLIRSFWQEREPRYEDYVQWALDAGMFLIRRGPQIIKNTGQTFRDYLQNGFENERATIDDWKLHLATLFPEVRLKNTLEVRSVDALPPELSVASLAVWTGVLYDEQALSQTLQLLAPLSFDEVEGARAQLCDRGLHAQLMGKTAFEWAEAVFEIAESGLKRRARKNGKGHDESIFLQPAAQILESRVLPAERSLRIFQETGSLVKATEIARPATALAG